MIAWRGVATPEAVAADAADGPADGPATADDELVYEPGRSSFSTGESSSSSFHLLVGKWLT
jgi:hypothetical protein